MANSRYRDPKTFGKKTLVLVMVATIVASAIMVNDIAITPAADFMFGAYGDATNFILSGPSLLMIPAALVTGVLLKHFSKKTIFVIGALLFTIGGLSCSFVLDSALFVCAMRAIIGLSVGMVASCCTALIAESFIDENKRGTMMGLWNAGMAVLGMVIGLAAAALVDESWQSVFKLYWMAVPILIVIVFCCLLYTSLALGWLGEPAVSALIHPALAALGLPDAAISAIAVAIGFIIITALHIVVGEPFGRYGMPILPTMYCRAS